MTAPVTADGARAGQSRINRSWIPTVAKEVIDFLEDRDLKSGPDILPLCVDAEGWHRIDKAEVAAGATQGRPRTKFVDWQVLLDIAQGD